LRDHLAASDDETLAQKLDIPLPLLEDLRAGRTPISASLALMLESRTGLSMVELRRTMGDRRSYFRVATQHPCRNTRN